MANSYVTYFEKKDRGKDYYQIYQITAKYDSSTFNVEYNKLQEMYDTNTADELHPEENNFYLDGQFYKCFVTYESCNDNYYGVYGVAFHACKESCTISYLFFRDDTNLSTMTAGAALTCYFFDEHRIKCP